MNGDFTELHNKITKELTTLSVVVSERWKAHADRSEEFRREQDRRFNELDKQFASLGERVDFAIKEGLDRRIQCAKEFDSKIRLYLGGFAIILTIIGSILKVFNIL